MTRSFGLFAHCPRGRFEGLNARIRFSAPPVASDVMWDMEHGTPESCGYLRILKDAKPKRFEFDGQEFFQAPLEVVITLDHDVSTVYLLGSDRPGTPADGCRFEVVSGDTSWDRLEVCEERIYPIGEFSLSPRSDLSSPDLVFPRPQPIRHSKSEGASSFGCRLKEIRFWGGVVDDWSGYALGLIERPAAFRGAQTDVKIETYRKEVQWAADYPERAHRGAFSYFPRSPDYTRSLSLGDSLHSAGT